VSADVSYDDYLRFGDDITEQELIAGLRALGYPDDCIQTVRDVHHSAVIAAHGGRLSLAAARRIADDELRLWLVRGYFERWDDDDDADAPDHSV
jgi:hypothetical protein